MKSKFKKLHIQRNGVHGTGFFTLEFENCNGAKGNFVATFEKEGDSDVINRTNCRVLKLDDLGEKWRGDEMADVIQVMLDEQCKKLSLEVWYDLIKK